MTERRPLSATYRLQLGPDLDFAAAAALVDQLAELGVSHLYLSPVLRAVPGSTHGYDVADPREVSPVMGGEQGLRELARRAHERGLGLVLDIVPNHVGTHWSNPYWDALLADGPAGDAARWFDVDWDPPLPGAAEKVLLPVLGGHYGEALIAGELRVEHGCHEHGPRPWRLRYHEHDLPLSAASIEMVERAGGPDELGGEQGDPESWQRLHALIERQHYRLVHWRSGHALINYRRFFAVDTLAAVRMEEPAVFEGTHELVLGLLREGVLDGLRIDHPDGLRDPTRYLEQLRAEAGERAWIVVEKIVHSLGEHAEALRDWPVDGTTGYEFCNHVLGLFTDPDCRPVLDALDRELGGEPDGFEAIAVACKRELLATDLAAEQRRLTRALWRLAQRHLTVRDLDDRELAEALAATIAHMDVYRPYVDPQTGRSSPEDVERVERAVEKARRSARGQGGEAARRYASPSVRGQGGAAARRYASPSVRGQGGGAARRYASPSDEVWDYVAAAVSGRLGQSADHLDAAARFAQLASAVMAKGVEDTAFYRHRRLLALNEVGGEPTRVGISVEEFHGLNTERAGRHPLGMLTTSTHDTKRGEDTRLRMAAISERPEAWAAFTRRWAPGAPDGQTATLVLQTLAGVWPLEGATADESVRRRLHDYLLKAQREARLRTDWRDPDEDFERATAEWLDCLLDDERFTAEAAEVIRPLQEIAMVSGLAQVLLRCTAPGVPDTYQGCELWEDSLVDPDNRRPVEFERRAGLVGQIADADPAELWRERRDGRVKLWVLRQALRTRLAHPGCFGERGAYEPLWADGPMAEHVVAFAREAPDGAQVIAVAPRLPGRVLEQGWGDTTLTLLPGEWRDALNARPVGSARLAELLAPLPVALLERA